MKRNLFAPSLQEDSTVHVILNSCKDRGAKATKENNNLVTGGGVSPIVLENMHRLLIRRH